MEMQFEESHMMCKVKFQEPMQGKVFRGQALSRGNDN